MRMGDLLGSGLLGGHRSRIDIEFHWGKSLEKGLDDPLINGIRMNVLADRHMILLTQIITQVTGAMFVLHHHFVPALSTIDDTMEQRRSIAWDPARFVAIIGRIIIHEHLLYLLKRFPGNVGWIDIIDANLPLVHG